MAQNKQITLTGSWLGMTLYAYNISGRAMSGDGGKPVHKCLAK